VDGVHSLLCRKLSIRYICNLWDVWSPLTSYGVHPHVHVGLLPFLGLHLWLWIKLRTFRQILLLIGVNAGELGRRDAQVFGNGVVGGRRVGVVDIITSYLAQELSSKVMTFEEK